MDRFMQFKKIKNLDERLRKLERYLKKLLDILEDIGEDLDLTRDVDYNIHAYTYNLRDVIKDCIEYLDLPVYEDSKLTSSNVMEIKKRGSHIEYWFKEMNKYKRDNLVTNEAITKEAIKEFKEALDKCLLKIRDFEDKKE
jgi:hypothetical protein